MRIDHRSYADQGIDLEPQHKIGPAGRRREDRGENAERAAEHRAIARRNGETLLAEPEISLRALTQQHSTFTRQQLARFVNRHTDGAEQFSAVMEKVEASPELVRLGEDGRGQQRFTTREMVEAEHRMEVAAGAMAGREGHKVLRMAAWRAQRAAERDGLLLGDEQKAALTQVTNGSDLSLVVGYAGTGKSAMFSVARAAWEAQGYQVRGLALSGIAAEGFEAGSGIASRTIASLEYAWSQGRDALTSRDVLVIDEAGMIGSRQMARVLAAAQSAGAKVVLVGDPEQLQAIEAGAAFRALAERHGAAEITAVRRQREDWQREATRELATGGTEAALGRYAAAGMVQAAVSREAARAALVAGWTEARGADAAQGRSEQSRIILAYTRDDVRALNDLARAQMRADGALHGPDQAVPTERGARDFAAGDRLMFLRNERGLGGSPDGRGGVAVKNGTLGTVLAVAAQGERLTVRLDRAGPERRQGQVVSFSVRDYAQIDHGYAATVHKAQGVTVDRAHVLATPHMDRHAAYVGLTRHREGVALHYGQDDFATPAQLASVLGRERAKDSTLDYRGDREAELVRRYAERRGLDPLRPDSEIVVRPERGARASISDREAETPVARRRRFAGLRLDAHRSPEPPAPAPPSPAPARVPTDHERQRTTLDGLTADYARAWSDAERMARAGLPVLPHQAAALERAGQALEVMAPNLSRDTRAALEREPALAWKAGTAEGVTALGAAIGAEREGRQALEARGSAAVRAWGALERAYAAAETAYDRQGQRDAGAHLEAFAKELKRDAQLDRLLRERGRALGVDAGSKLDLVVRTPADALSRTLHRDLGLSLGRGGPSMGR